MPLTLLFVVFTTVARISGVYVFLPIQFICFIFFCLSIWYITRRLNHIYQPSLLALSLSFPSSPISSAWAAADAPGVGVGEGSMTRHPNPGQHLAHHPIKDRRATHNKELALLLLVRVRQLPPGRVLINKTHALRPPERRLVQDDVVLEVGRLVVLDALQGVGKGQFESRCAAYTNRIRMPYTVRPR